MNNLQLFDKTCNSNVISENYTSLSQTKNLKDQKKLNTSANVYICWTFELKQK
jgi:hypothetical protein